FTSARSVTFQKMFAKRLAIFVLCDIMELSIKREVLMLSGLRTTRNDLSPGSCVVNGGARLLDVSQVPASGGGVTRSALFTSSW
ncbi:MAG: hypothetical protein ACOC1I_07425, partial [Spirochaetota bacterium]